MHAIRLDDRATQTEFKEESLARDCEEREIRSKEPARAPFDFAQDKPALRKAETVRV
jgi:hypothetical protein